MGPVVTERLTTNINADQEDVPMFTRRWRTWADGSQGPLAEQVLGRRRAGLEPPGAPGLHVGLLVAIRHAGGPGAVVQEAVRGHHLGVAPLAAAHAALRSTGHTGSKSSQSR